MNFMIRRQDLFSVDKKYTLAHCISQDTNMGAGIAKIFRDKAPKLPEIIRMQRPRIGDAIYFMGEGMTVFNLITKEKYWQKPTYDSLRCSLQTMRNLISMSYVPFLAMPKIGCGLDRLEWDKVEVIIKEVFADMDIDILICYQ